MNDAQVYARTDDAGNGVPYTIEEFEKHFAWYREDGHINILLFDEDQKGGYIEAVRDEHLDDVAYERSDFEKNGTKAKMIECELSEYEGVYVRRS